MTFSHLMLRATFTALAFAYAANTGVCADTVRQDTVTSELNVKYGEAGGQDLLLDIYFPPGYESLKDGETTAAIVFVHGGGNRSGGATDPLSSLLNLEDSTPIYDGTVLSDRGNVVVVTLQYRLGALGYLYEPSLAVGGQTGVAGNYGLLDILEALRWERAVVSTSAGCAGLEPVSGKHLLVADGPAPFAEAAIDLLGDPERRRRLGRDGRAWAEATYDWTRIGDRLLATVEGVVGHARR